ncbi:MAG TPA: histidine phosphatase family protein [Candidatus Saccharimonadales bacterium]|jgi:alpha-ribazole phosphatase|nr:histidine phosphatase family protein [Candidatus Saccharimonadales bacterium]
MNDLAPLHSGCSLRLVLLRHGEPFLAVPDICYGKLDVELSSHGIRQVQDKLPFLKLVSPEMIFTSPRKRTVETARIVGAALGLTPQPVEELAEIDFGAFEGRTYDEIQRLYPGEYKMWMEQPAAITFPGGEGHAALKKRVLSFTGTLPAKPPARTVAIVAHGGVNRVILADALGMTDEMAFRIDQPLAAVSVIDYFGETPVVRLING